MQVYRGIDIFKMGCAVLVVATHTKPLYGISIWNYISLCFFQIAVPYFFMVSSFLFWKGRQNLQRFIMRLLLLYSIWFFIELPIIICKYCGNNIHIDIEKLLLDFFFNNTFYASWFLSALGEAMFIIWMTRKMPLWFFAVLGLFCYFLCVCDSMYYGFLPYNAKVCFNSLFSNVHPSHSCIVALPFVIIGRLFAERDIRIWPSKKKYYPIIFVGILFFIEILAVHDYRKSVTCFFSLLVISFVLMRISMEWSPNISSDTSRKIRQMSVLIFLFHLLFFRTISLPFGFQSFLIVLIVSVCFAFFVTWLSTIVKVFRYLS